MAISLSQCMIVKNEAHNIERALTWGKSIVCEQIVVDTGSGDDTAGLAKSMGAVVYHFDWCNDFSKARNFAISKANGDWIAFLDADEYIDANDAHGIIPYLETLQDVKAVFCPLLNIDKNGALISEYLLLRFFRNLPDVRYTGRIHEYIDTDDAFTVQTQAFKIYHTGYGTDEDTKISKAARNLKLLREEILYRPDDINLKVYLADALICLSAQAGAGDREKAEARSLYKEAINSSSTHCELKKRAYTHIFDEYVNSPGIDKELDKHAETAYSEFPRDVRFICYYALILARNGDLSSAFDVISKNESILQEAINGSNAAVKRFSGFISSVVVFIAQGKGDIETVLKYAAVMLRDNRDNPDVLRPYIAALKKHYVTDDKVISKLSEIYDLSNPKDVLLLARCSKDIGAINLAKALMG